MNDKTQKESEVAESEAVIKAMLVASEQEEVLKLSGVIKNVAN